jgi:hypothetical protein
MTETHVVPTRASGVSLAERDLDFVSAVALRHVIHDSLRPRVEIAIDLGRVDFPEYANESCQRSGAFASHTSPDGAHR